MRIAITGGTGSLGGALIRRLSQNGAERIVTCSRDEQKRLALQAQYQWHQGVKVYAGDIRDTGRLADIFNGCEVVIHAAARKVVSGHHDEPREMLQTNVVGTQNVIAAAREAQVRKLLFISSDKAVHPQNVYGISKAMAEHLVISENARSWSRGLRCSIIRYGNVLASNGSVVRVWRQQLAAQQPLGLTDVRMTRFWLTLEQAAEFVLAAVGDLRGGEIFVPDLKSAPLTNIARALMEDNSTPEFISTGIRPGGEKLHEELISGDEATRAVFRNRFYIIPPTLTADSWDAAPWLGDKAAYIAECGYRSDSWPHRWTVPELRQLLQEPRS